MYIEKEQSGQTLLHLPHLDAQQVSIKPQSESSLYSKKSPSCAQAQKGLGTNHSLHAAVPWTSQLSRYQYSLKSSVQHFRHGSKTPQTATDIHYTSNRLQSCWGCWSLSKVPSLTLTAYLQAWADASKKLRCTVWNCSLSQLGILLCKFWQLKEALGRLNASQSKEVWNPRRAPKPRKIILLRLGLRLEKSSSTHWLQQWRWAILEFGPWFWDCSVQSV